MILLLLLRVRQFRGGLRYTLCSSMGEERVKCIMSMDRSDGSG